MIRNISARACACVPGKLCNGACCSAVQWCDAACLVYVTAQKGLPLARQAMATVRDARSLSAIGAKSAVASQAWVHERLGRTDVQVSCVLPLVHAFAVVPVVLLFVPCLICVLCKVRWAPGKERPRDAEDEAAIYVASCGR